MENNVFDQNVSDEIYLTPLAESFLLSAAKWAKFLSILGFVGIGIMLLFAVFSNMIFGSTLENIQQAQGIDYGAIPPERAGLNTVVFIIYAVVYAVVYFFPILYLYKFSSKAIEAIVQKDVNGIELALGSLKSHYKFIGILAIIGLGLSAIVLLFALIGIGVSAYV